MTSCATMKRIEDECPGCDRRSMPEVERAAEVIEEVAARLGAAILFDLTARAGESEPIEGAGRMIASRRPS